MRISFISLALFSFLFSTAAIDGSLDPECVVESWSTDVQAAKIIDINFTDSSWPNSWAGETSRDCPDYTDGGYVNAIIRVGEVNYPVLFHNCMFATKESYNGYAGATAAFSRQYYIGENAVGNSTWGLNNWKSPGHTTYLEDNIVTERKGKKDVPVYGEAGFVQMCRNAATVDDDGNKTSLHGWMEIDHLPYVERIQWSWSSTSWGRGIKCDVKIGEQPWQPLVWMGSERQKQGWTVFSDQGYFMENVIDAHDVSLRWRVWDGEDPEHPVQTGADGSAVFTQKIDPYAQMQAPRVHKIKIYGTPLTAEDAEYAYDNQLNDVGVLSDLSDFGFTNDPTKTDEPASVGLLAFPTAEGFGKYATGGRGGEVVKVTSLADDGTEGTLRWAFEQHKGRPITIVFTVSGEIALRRELRISRADWTLAGQSAPGAGIVITRNKVNLGGSSNFIVRNVRFRIGQRDVNGNILAENALGAENCYNFIIDHCTFGWSVEENMNTVDSHFLTVQHCIVHEGLYDAGHSKGARGYGCQWGGSPATYHHNLLAHNHSRSCRFNGARGEDQMVFIEYANNVNYNFGGSGGCYGGENTADITSYNGLNSAHECNFINNYYLPGPGSGASPVFVTSSYARSGATSWGPSKWYVNGNIFYGKDAVNADNWKAMVAEGYKIADIRSEERIVPALPYYQYTPIATIGNYDPQKYMLANIDDAQQAFASVVSHSGTIHRDIIEVRVANDVLSATATYGGKALGATSGFIDTENDAEGFIPYPTEYEVADDTDNDGIADTWEASHGLMPDVPDNNNLNSDGYTALEVYLASLMGEQMKTDFSDSIEATYISASMTYDSSTGSIILGDECIGSTISIYALDGRLIDTLKVRSTTVPLEKYADCQVVIVSLSGNNLCPSILRVKI